MTYPRAWLALAGIFVLNGLAANVEFETERAIEKEAKSTHYPARIYSKKCMAKDKDWIAKQSDGGKWEIHCTKTLRT